MVFRYMHLTTTALVRNMKTRSIYTQFHMVFDYGFTYIH